MFVLFVCVIVCVYMSASMWFYVWGVLNAHVNMYVVVCVCGCLCALCLCLCWMVFICLLSVSVLCLCCASPFFVETVYMRVLFGVVYVDVAFCCVVCVVC